MQEIRVIYFQYRYCLYFGRERQDDSKCLAMQFTTNALDRQEKSEVSYEFPLNLGETTSPLIGNNPLEPTDVYLLNSQVFAQTENQTLTTQQRTLFNTIPQISDFELWAKQYYLTLCADDTLMVTFTDKQSSYKAKEKFEKPKSVNSGKETKTRKQAISSNEIAVTAMRNFQKAVKLFEENVRNNNGQYLIYNEKHKCWQENKPCFFTFTTNLDLPYEVIVYAIGLFFKRKRNASLYIWGPDNDTDKLEYAGRFENQENCHLHFHGIIPNMPYINEDEFIPKMQIFTEIWLNCVRTACKNKKYTGDISKLNGNVNLSASGKNGEKPQTIDQQVGYLIGYASKSAQSFGKYKRNFLCSHGFKSSYKASVPTNAATPANVQTIMENVNTLLLDKAKIWNGHILIDKETGECMQIGKLKLKLIKGTYANLARSAGKPYEKHKMAKAIWYEKDDYIYPRKSKNRIICDLKIPDHEIVYVEFLPDILI